MAEIIRIDGSTYRFEDGGVRFFLFEGKNEAILIDSGMNCPDARRIAESVTDKPLRLVNTHTDPDHISGNGAFGEVTMSHAEWESFGGEKNASLVPVKDGDIIDPGDRPLRVIDLPGHTPGSIALLDEKNRVLYGGDSIQDGRIFMFGERRDMDKYVESLSLLWETKRDLFDSVFPSHGTIPVGPDLIPRLIDAAKKIIAGESDGREVDMHGHPVKYHDFGFAGFLCSAE